MEKHRCGWINIQVTERVLVYYGIFKQQLMKKIKNLYLIFGSKMILIEDKFKNNVMKVV